MRGQETFSINDQTVNVSDSVVYVVSVTIAQHCPGSARAATDNVRKTKHSCVRIKLNLQNQAVGQICLPVHSCLISDLDH